MFTTALVAPHNKDMSKPTPTKWNCLNCGLEEYKPAWLAAIRQFCSPKCVVQYKLKQDPNYYLTRGAMADPLKISATLKRKHKAGEIVVPSRAGSTATKATRLKMSNSQKEWYKNGGTRTKGVTLNISPEGLARKIAATQAMRKRLANRGKLTDIEKIIDDYLHANNIPHEHEYPVGRKIMDFYLPEQQWFIEADGAYWHNPTKDAVKDTYVTKLRPEVKIIRCAEKDIKNGNWLQIWGARRGV